MTSTSGGFSLDQIPNPLKLGLLPPQPLDGNTEKQAFQRELHTVTVGELLTYMNPRIEDSKHASTSFRIYFQGARIATFSLKESLVANIFSFVPISRFVHFSTVHLMLSLLRSKLDRAWKSAHLKI
jgi:hypothetical protein